MDGSRFDGFTRKLANRISRRQTLQGLAGGTLAGLIAHLGLEEAGAACVKLGKKGCKGPQNKKCCQGATCKGGSKRKAGTCACKGSLAKCGAKCVNIQTDTQHCGACDQPCPEREICQQGSCVFTGGCPAGKNYCDDVCQARRADGTCTDYCNPGEPCFHAMSCPDSNGDARCRCITDVEGTTHCAFTHEYLYCIPCKTNADCQEGWACYEAHDCGCPTDEDDPDVNGNGYACAPVRGASDYFQCGHTSV